jgi:hypothetical protein
VTCSSGLRNWSGLARARGSSPPRPSRARPSQLISAGTRCSFGADEDAYGGALFSRHPSPEEASCSQAHRHASTATLAPWQITRPLPGTRWATVASFTLAGGRSPQRAEASHGKTASMKHNGAPVTRRPRASPDRSCLWERDRSGHDWVRSG